MRTLLVSHRYPPDGVAGVERYTQNLAHALTRDGHGASVVTRRPTPSTVPPRIEREYAPSGVTIYRLVGPDAGLDRFLGYQEHFEPLLETVMIEAAPDLIHINHLKDLPPRTIEIAHRAAIPVVLSLHDFYFACPLIHLQKLSGQLCDGPVGGWECAHTCFAHEGGSAILRWGLRAAYFRRLLASAERIICPSHFVASQFEKLGTDAARLRVIPNGISIESTDRSAPELRSPRAMGRFNLAFLGAVTAHKGIHVVLDALRLANLGPVNFSVLGPVADSQYLQHLRALAATIPNLELRLYGAYEPPELSLLLSGVHCVVVPSQVPETFSLTAREAMVRGIPVIAARIGALPEAIIEGENGFTFDATRPSELAAILQRMVEDETLLSRLREGAQRSRVLSVTEHLQHVYAIYEEAIEAFTHRRGPCQADLDELRSLHQILLQLGFGTPP